MAAMVAATCGVAWFTYDATKLREKLDETVRLQQAELNELNARTAAAERQLQIERATYGDLAKQVKALEQENATLKEDLAFFQSLTATGKEGAISVNRFRMVPDLVLFFLFVFLLHHKYNNTYNPYIRVFYNRCYFCF